MSEKIDVINLWELEARARRRMRLVHVMTVPTSLAFLRGQLGYMKAHGFDVAVVSSPGEPLEEFGAEQGVETVAVDMPRKITPLRDLRALVRLGRALRAIRPTIVHAHTPKGGLLGMLGALIARTPVRVYHMRGLPMVTASGHRRHLLRWSERVACLVAHEVLCVSHSLREIAIEERICPPHKIKVLRQAVATASIAIGDSIRACTKPRARTRASATTSRPMQR